MAKPRTIRVQRAEVTLQCPHCDSDELGIEMFAPVANVTDDGLIVVAPNGEVEMSKLFCIECGQSSLVPPGFVVEVA